MLILFDCFKSSIIISNQLFYGKFILCALTLVNGTTFDLYFILSTTTLSSFINVIQLIYTHPKCSFASAFTFHNFHPFVPLDITAVHPQPHHPIIFSSYLSYYYITSIAFIELIQSIIYYLSFRTLIQEPKNTITEPQHSTISNLQPKINLIKLNTLLLPQISTRNVLLLCFLIILTQLSFITHQFQ